MPAARHIATALAATLVLCTGTAIAQSDFPTRPLRLLVPVPPGGGADFIARLVAERMAADLGKPILVENKGGASGAIASQEVARAPADGYLLLECYVATHGTAPAVSKLPYDAVRDFSPVGMIAATSNVLVVNAQVKAASLKEFLGLAGAKAQALSFGSTGTGSATHLTMEYLEQQAGVDLVHIPYKGAGPAMADLMSGRVAAMFPGLTAAIPHIRAGKLRAIAISSATRSPLLPEVPTIAESGFPSFNALQWYGLCAPPKTPRPVIERLNKSLNDSLGNAELKTKLADQAAEVMPMTPERFGAFILDEVTKWTKLVRDAKLEIEQ